MNTPPLYRIYCPAADDERWTEDPAEAMRLLLAWRTELAPHPVHGEIYHEDREDSAPEFFDPLATFTTTTP